jgi:hydroxyethylthiazole kinase
VAVRTVATRTGGAAVASGATDFVADGRRLAHVRNGHPFMSRITGSGCMATAIAGAFAAVESDPFLAALEATIAFGIAGEMAAGKSAGPGTFRANLIDAVANLDRATIMTRTAAEIVGEGE